jgi:hypothetical protein
MEEDAFYSMFIDMSLEAKIDKKVVRTKNNEVYIYFEKNEDIYIIINKDEIMFFNLKTEENITLTNNTDNLYFILINIIKQLI